VPSRGWSGEHPVTGWTTPDLCDAHPDRVRVLAPILHSYGGREAFCGEVVTLSCFEDNSLVKELGETAGRGRVLVVDGGGSVRKALLGDLIAARFAANGWAGVVINGAVRDVEVLRSTEIGIRALAAIPVRTEKRGLGDLGLPVTFAGVTIGAGEHLYADASGVIVTQRPLA
jgi:regulator of ribonuclease activity A